MLSGVSVTCFALSYLVVLLLEVSRLFFRAPVRLAVMIGFMIVGLFTHTVYVVIITQAELEAGTTAPLSNWHDWCLMVAWVVAAAYLGLAVRRPQMSLGLFMLPLVLGLIAIGYAYKDAGSFARDDAVSIWRIVHGVALLVGTVAVTLGFAAGLMYLLQSDRLKKKIPPRQGLQLPSLEWLQRFNRETLLISSCLLAVGLISGIVLNLIEERSIRWTDPVILSSAVLFTWIVSAAIFEYFYKPAQQGRKIAYLTLASFIFLGMVLWFVLRGDHAKSAQVHDRASPHMVASSPTAGGVR